MMAAASLDFVALSWKTLLDDFQRAEIVKSCSFAILIDTKKRNNRILLLTKSLSALVWGNVCK